MRFAVIGRTELLLHAAYACLSRGHQCVFVASSEPSPEYRVGRTEFAELADKSGTPFLFGAKLDSPAATQLIQRAKPDLAISVNWPTVLRASVRALFPQGVWNAHAGDLPRFRGNACPNWAILLGEKSVTVCVHQMVEELDAGPIIARATMPLTDQTYIGHVYAWLQTAVPKLFADAMDDLATGKLHPEPQPADPKVSLRCYPRRPSDDLINWSAPSTEIARLVRASAEPFAGAFSVVDDATLVRVWRARAEPHPSPCIGVPGQVTKIEFASGAVHVLTGDGILVIEQASLDGHQCVMPSQIITSTRRRLGLSQSAIAAHIIALSSSRD